VALVPQGAEASLREALAAALESNRELREDNERLRVDNGMPWGSQGDRPTDLACWLAGLGVDCPRFAPVSGTAEVEAFAAGTWPVVLKAVSGGYDGKGV